MDVFETLKDIIIQLTKLGPEGLTLVGCWIFGYIIRKIPQINNKFIPLICPFLGMVIYPLLANTESVSGDVKNPIIGLFIIGFALGFISWAVHKALLKGLEEKFPSLKKWLNGEENTEFVKKEDVTKTESKNTNENSNQS